MIKKEFRKDRVELTRLYKEFLEHDDFTGIKGEPYYIEYWNFLLNLSLKYGKTIKQIAHTMNI